MRAFTPGYISPMQLTIEGYDTPFGHYTCSLTTRPAWVSRFHPIFLSNNFG